MSETSLGRHKGTIAAVMQTVASSPELRTPVFRADIASQAQAEASPDVPLVYIWNECRVHASFNVSVNGGKVGALLEPHLGRTDPDFSSLLEYMTKTLAVTMNNSVLQFCRQHRALPSQLF